MMEENISIEQAASLRSDDVNEIIGRPPRWIVRWGITVFFFVIMLILLLGWIIKYPDIVNGSFHLTSSNAPKSVDAHTNGKISKLFVKNSDSVEKNEVLGYLESTADPDEVVQTSHIIDSLASLLNQNAIEKIPDVFPKSLTQMGELQLDFQKFNQAYLQLRSYLSAGFYMSKKKSIQRDLANLTRQRQSLLNQKEIAGQALEIAEQDYKVQQQLAKEKIIAPLELKKEESQLLSKKMPIEQITGNLINIETLANDKKNELFELDKNISEQKITFLQALNTFKSNIEDWKYKYLLAAPISGRLNFMPLVQENQTVSSAQQLFYVIPTDAAYMGVMYVSQFNLGKIHRDDKVLIKFLGYPFEEYGSLTGKVEYISNVPLDSNYWIKIALPKGLTTNYGKLVNYREGLPGTGEIITANRRVLQKFMFSLRRTLNGG